MRYLHAMIASFLVAGCAVEPADPCAEAADHVAACTGDVFAGTAATCDPARAESLLAMDCDQLAAAAAAGKADGWWDAVMCSLGADAYCTRPQEETPPPPASVPRTITGIVYELGGDSVYVENVVIELRDRATGETTTTVSGALGVFTIPALTNHTYEMRPISPRGLLEIVDMPYADFVRLYVY